MKQAIFTSAFLAAVLLAGGANAQRYESYAPRKQVSLSVRGGIGNYTGELGSYTNVGPVWGVILNLQPLRILGVEIAYEGARNGINTLFDDVAIVKNGGSAMLKFAPPLTDAVKPWAGIGLGVSYASVTRNETTYRSDLMEELPLAIGLEFNTRDVTAGIRGSYHFLIDEQIIRTASGRYVQGGLFDVAATVGLRF